MQDPEDEEGRKGSATKTKVSDMHGSASNEDSPPASTQKERKTSSNTHPKKKRKVNHGQDVLLL